MPDGSGAIHTGYHPIFGTVATVHYGERIGLVAPDLPTYAIDVPGKPCDPVRDGPEWIFLSTVAGMLASRPL